MTGNEIQKGMVGAAIDGIRRFYWYCRKLLLGRKRLKLVLSLLDSSSARFLL